jgi:alpha-tubulin suppressor-like RCC1 family protein
MSPTVWMARAERVCLVWGLLLIACASPRIQSGSSEEAGTPEGGGHDDAGDGAIDSGADAAVDEQDAADGGLDRSKLRLSIGHEHACGLFHDGQLKCWGRNSEGQLDLPAGAFRDVSAGDFHTCVIEQTGKLTCVGRNRDGQRVTETGPYMAVAAGDAHTCALRLDRTAECWGKNDFLQAEPPDVPFSQITAGEAFTCGIRQNDQKVQCWGSDSANRSTPPQDMAFVSIDAGRAHACGRTTEDALVCWGDTMFRAPQVRVTRVAAGNCTSCAVLSNGSVLCWPVADYDAHVNAAAPHLSVFGGDNAVCFVPKQGKLVCTLCGDTSPIPKGLIPPPDDFL